jgi:hypothetical protein
VKFKEIERRRLLCLKNEAENKIAEGQYTLERIEKALLDLDKLPDTKGKDKE